MNIIESTSNGVAIITIEGILNAASSPQLKKHFEESGNDKPVIINLEHVEFIDSSGLGILVNLARKKKAQNADLKLANMNNRVKRVFEITQAYSLFDIYDDVAAAAGN